VFRTFIGVDLGGGKGKNTAVARLEADGDSIKVVDYGTGRESPWFDQPLIEYLRGFPDAALGLDAPLTLPVCLRCQLPVCPTAQHCEVETVRWFRDRDPDPNPRKKPRYTPYTQRATEVILHEEHLILPRETMGQGMGPLTSRASHLCRALSDLFTLDRNLIEVYPKATIARLCGERAAARYKRSGASPQTRLDILNNLPNLSFAPGAWREDGLTNDHKFDAVICAYTTYLWSRGECLAPPSDLVARDGWIWMPRTTVSQANERPIR